VKHLYFAGVELLTPVHLGVVARLFVQGPNRIFSHLIPLHHEIEVLTGAMAVPLLLDNGADSGAPHSGFFQLIFHLLDAWHCRKHRQFYFLAASGGGLFLFFLWFEHMPTFDFRRGLIRGCRLMRGRDCDSVTADSGCGYTLSTKSIPRAITRLTGQIIRPTKEPI
jgi:hypothetical protein